MSAAERSLSASRLRQVLHYDPCTGIWTWLVSLSIRKPAGSRAGDLKPSGYELIGVDGKRYRSHRLAWLYMTGEWPTEQIDHIDCNRSNNRWKNLRPATNKQNSWNRGANKNNRSGHKGVFWNSQKQKWNAKIQVDGDSHHLGFFDRPDQASEAYQAASIKFHREFGRTSGLCPVSVQ